MRKEQTTRYSLEEHELATCFLTSSTTAAAVALVVYIILERRVSLWALAHKSHVAGKNFSDIMAQCSAIHFILSQRC